MRVETDVLLYKEGFAKAELMAQRRLAEEISPFLDHRDFGFCDRNDGRCYQSKTDCMA